MGLNPPSRVLKLPANFSPSQGAHASRPMPHVSPLNTSVLNAADRPSNSTVGQSFGVKAARASMNQRQTEPLKVNEESADESSESENDSDAESRATSSSEDESNRRLPLSTGGKTRPGNIENLIFLFVGRNKILQIRWFGTCPMYLKIVSSIVLENYST